jgi:23S rRNA pseudouridine1911/1915/1917 synthase
MMPDVEAGAAPGRGPATPGTRVLRVPDDAGRERVDRFVADVTGLSRSHVQKLISAGQLTTGGLPLKANAIIAPGTTLELIVPEPIPLDLAPAPEIDVKVVYEDADLLIVDKPAGLVVHPGAGRASGTLVQALAGKIAGGDPERPGVVHRLDRGTSGLMALARSEESHRRLQELVRERAFERTYTALVHGRPRSRSGRIEAPIGRDRGDATRVSLDTDTPREAITNFEVDQIYPAHALLRVRLETGRMHQIRVHLAAIDLPVAGDATYGRPEPGLARQFLHASALAFPHPFSDERVETSSSLPEDLGSFLAGLG